MALTVWWQRQRAIIQNDRGQTELNSVYVCVYVCVCGGVVEKVLGSFMEGTLEVSFEGGGGEGQGSWVLV